MFLGDAGKYELDRIEVNGKAVALQVIPLGIRRFWGLSEFGFDFTENFLIDATGRLENYSDFGDAFVYKLSSRYKLADDRVTVRGSFSTGFRAPSLHQIYSQKAQYSFVPGQGIQVSGLVNNVSREANLLGVPKLDAETSTNLTFGIGVNPNDNLSFTVDYYDNQ